MSEELPVTDTAERAASPGGNSDRSPSRERPKSGWETERMARLPPMKFSHVPATFSDPPPVVQQHETTKAPPEEIEKHVERMMKSKTQQQEKRKLLEAKVYKEKEWPTITESGIEKLTDRMTRAKPPPDPKKFAFKSTYKTVEVTPEQLDSITDRLYKNPKANMRSHSFKRKEQPKVANVQDMIEKLYNQPFTHKEQVLIKLNKKIYPEAPTQKMSKSREKAFVERIAEQNAQRQARREEAEKRLTWQSEFEYRPKLDPAAEAALADRLSSSASAP